MPLIFRQSLLYFFRLLVPPFLVRGGRARVSITKFKASSGIYSHYAPLSTSIQLNERNCARKLCQQTTNLVKSAFNSATVRTLHNIIFNAITREKRIFFLAWYAFICALNFKSFGQTLELCMDFPSLTLEICRGKVQTR